MILRSRASMPLGAETSSKFERSGLFVLFGCGFVPGIGCSSPL